MLVVPYAVVSVVLSIPMAYIWLSHYYEEYRERSSKQPAALPKPSDLESRGQSEEDLIPPIEFQ